MSVRVFLVVIGLCNIFVCVWITPGCVQIMVLQSRISTIRDSMAHMVLVIKPGEPHTMLAACSLLSQIWNYGEYI